MSVEVKSSKKNRAQRRAEKSAVKGARKRSVKAAAAAESTASKRPPGMDDRQESESDGSSGERVNVVDFEGSYRLFESEARGLSRGEVTLFNGNPMVVFQNVRSGALAVLAERAVIESDPTAPEVDFERVERSVRAAEALVYASRLASGVIAPKSDLGAKTSAVFEVRDVLLSSAVAAVKAGVLKGKQADKVTAIQAGRGPIDAAQDCIDLAALFRANASVLKGKTAVTPAQVEQAAAQGSELLHRLAPAGVEVASGAPDDVAAAADMRDRMAAVVAKHYAYVARIGGWRWGFELTAHVPPMRSRSLARGEKKPDAEPVVPVVEPTKPE